MPRNDSLFIFFVEKFGLGGRPMTSGKSTGACTRWDRRGRGPGNQGKIRRITSRRFRWQQGLVATCVDSSHEAIAEGEERRRDRRMSPYELRRRSNVLPGGSSCLPNSR